MSPIRRRGERFGPEPWTVFAVEQAHLPLREHHVHRAALVDLAHPRHLPVRVAHQTERPDLALRPGDDAQAAVVRRRLADGDEGEHEPGLHPDTGRVLVPAVEGRGAGLLDAEDGVREQDVGADQILDGVEQPRVAAQPVDPVEQQVGLDVERPADRFGPRLLERLHPGPECVALRFVEHVDAGQEAVLVKGLDFDPGQSLSHVLVLVQGSRRPAARRATGQPAGRFQRPCHVAPAEDPAPGAGRCRDLGRARACYSRSAGPRPGPARSAKARSRRGRSERQPPGPPPGRVSGP